MHGQMTKRILVRTVFLFLASGLQADITFPGQAPPQADAQTARVWRGGQTIIPLRAHYGGGGTVTFSIVERPEHGKLSGLRLVGDNRATIVYQNDNEESVTSDGFRYVAKTNGGRTSSPAEVRITVEEALGSMVLPARLEFGEIMAGESASLPLAITNEGGGVLEGRLSISDPWHLPSANYRVKAGRTEVIEISFRPGEGREFVGQLTLTSADGTLRSVQLSGTAAAPVRVEPDSIQIDPPRTERGPRIGFVSLTNQTERAQQLKIVASPNIRPIPDVLLAPHETKQISIVVLLHREVPLHEEIVFAGEGFKARLPVDSDAAPANDTLANKGRAGSAASPASGTPPAPPAQMFPAQSVAIPAASVPASTTRSLKTAFVAVRAQRTEASSWELRWARPKRADAKYRIEERFLSLDDKGELLTTWQGLAAPDIAESGDEVVAQINGLSPKQPHILRVTALSGGGAVLWESPPVALAPPRRPVQSNYGWLLVFGFALLVFLILRWRARRANA